MTAAAFILFCGLWRLWLGGVPYGVGPTWLKHLAGFCGVFTFVWLNAADPVLAGAHALLFLAYWRAMGHGPMLRFPLGRDDGDVILRHLLGGWKGEGENWSVQETGDRWWIYAAVRYVGFALVWAGAVQALGYRFPGELLFAGIAICITYRVLANATLPYGWIGALGGVKPGERADGYHDYFHAHYCEPIAGAAIGLALVLGFA